jgi:hypothetical protein
MKKREATSSIEKSCAPVDMKYLTWQATLKKVMVDRIWELTILIMSEMNEQSPLVYASNVDNTHLLCYPLLNGTLDDKWLGWVRTKAEIMNKEKKRSEWLPIESCLIKLSMTKDYLIFSSSVISGLDKSDWFSLSDCSSWIRIRSYVTLWYLLL